MGNWLHHWRNYTLRSFTSIPRRKADHWYYELRNWGFVIPLPPLPEQRGIVRYLDHVDGRIRRYVDAKEKLVGLLEEERQAVVNRAVTRGLDPNVRLKPSGVEWLGDVPEHWEVRRAKFHLLKLMNDQPLAEEENYVGMTHITGVRPRKKTVTMFLAESNTRIQAVSDIW